MTTDYPRTQLERDRFFRLETEDYSRFSLPDFFSENLILMNSDGTGEIILNGFHFEGGHQVDVTAAFGGAAYSSLKASEGVENIWFENTPKIFIKNIAVDSNIDEHKVGFDVELSSAAEVMVEVYSEDRLVNVGSSRTGRIDITLSDVNLWSPKHPFLYDAIVTAGKDVVKTRFAIKKISVSHEKKRSGVYLNNERIFPIACYSDNIDAAKRAGFDMIIADEKKSPQWYADCEQKGMLVWQLSDMDSDSVGLGSVIISGKDGTDILSSSKNGQIIKSSNMNSTKGKAFFYEPDISLPFFFCFNTKRMIKKGAVGAVFTGDPKKMSPEKLNRIRTAFLNK